MECRVPMTHQRNSRMWTHKGLRKITGLLCKYFKRLGERIVNRVAKIHPGLRRVGRAVLRTDRERRGSGRLHRPRTRVAPSQREIKGGTGGNRRFHPNTASGSCNNFLTRRQADAAAGDIHPVASLQRLKNALKPLRFDTDAVVLDADQPKDTLTGRSDFDPERQVVTTVFNGVRKQILK